MRLLALWWSAEGRSRGGMMDGTQPSPPPTQSPAVYSRTSIYIVTVGNCNSILVVVAVV